MRYTEVSAVNGVRNDVDAERFVSGDLQSATNIDIDETGKARRRAGTSVVFPGSAHSVWGDKTQGFFVQGGWLHRFLPDRTTTALVEVLGDRVSYVGVNSDVYWTDGVAAGVVSQGVSYPWGIAPPPRLGGIATTGNVSGQILGTMTYVDANGVESGAPQTSAFEGSISLSLPVSGDPRVTHKHIYMSAVGGDVPLLSMVVPNSEVTVQLTDMMPRQTVPVRTQFLTPPPAGTVLGYYRGRTYVAVGPFLMFSQPYEYALFDLRSDFLTFSADIQTFAAVSDGIFIGTTNETFFLRGTNPAEFTMQLVAPHGTIRGTEQIVAGDTTGADDERGKAVVALWMAKTGLTLGNTGGTIEGLTARKFTPPAASTGAALIKKRGSTPQYITSLFN